jgi:circadian clock protein KaiC
MRSIGIDLETHINSGLLRFETWRPTQSGLEMHLLRAHKLVERHQPEAVVVDPISNMLGSDSREIHAMFMRLLDFLKNKSITALFTALTRDHNNLEQTDVGISSLVDTWILLRDVELNGERNRCLYLLKSRGMAHSNQIREFLLTPNGVKLVPAYIGPGTVLTGSARLAQQAREQAEERTREQETGLRRRELEHKRQILEARIAALRSEFGQEEERLARIIRGDEERVLRIAEDELEMSKLRNIKSAGNGRSVNGDMT